MSDLRDLGELGLIGRLLPYLARATGELVIGAGEDDAAAWLEPDGSYTVATCDTAVEGVHFDLARQRPEDVGWRALALALGDLAAKGAAPRYGLAAIAVPDTWSSGLIAAVYRGMSELAAEVGLLLVGGDTTSAPRDAALMLALLGTTPVRPIPRSGAQPGWKVGVTGPLGGASPDWARPRPLLARGAELARSGLCCGDVSDGLLREMDKFAHAAGVGCRLLLESIPVVDGRTPHEALASGEEVELVCAGPETAMAGLLLVGELTADGVVAVIGGDGREVEVAERGYDHFR